MTRSMTLAAAVTLLATGANAASVDWPFHGCEAADIAALAAPHEPVWQGQTHAMGPWSLSHEAVLACTGEDCAARLTMAMHHADLDTPAPTLTAAPFSFMADPGRQAHSLTLEGEAAASLAAHLGDAAFAAGDGSRRVIMDYGSLADAVTIRIRTEINCSEDGGRCTVEADPLAFIAYDDREACGSFATALTPTN